MADKSKIEWTDATWNVINGCSIVSPGCTNCYAMRLAGTRLAHHPSRAGLTAPSKAGPVWTGEARFWEPFYRQPMQWTKPRRIFVCAHGDLFHETVPDEWIDRVMAMAALCPHHTFQVLTKRAARMRSYFNGRWQVRALAALMRMREPKGPMLSRKLEASYRFQEAVPLPNVHAGVSAEDQRRADERVPELIATNVAVRWVSAEPLLGPVDLAKWIGYLVRPDMGFVEPGERELLVPYPRLDWVEAGGESGPGARPMRLQWVRDLRDQCATAGVAFGFKQWGDWLPGEVYSRPSLPDDDPAAMPGPPSGSLSGGHARFPQFERGQAEETFPGRPTHWWAGDCWAGEISVNVGKQTAGRMLDGRTHDGLREART